MQDKDTTFQPENQKFSLSDIAHEYLMEGLNPLPLWKTKNPMLEKGHPYLYQLVPEQNIPKLFSKAEKIGIVCGDVSDGFECMDFDGKNGEPVKDIFSKYLDVPAVKDIVDRHKLPLVKTPSGGYHIYYRHSEKGQGSRHLASWSTGKVMIETRGHGGYVATVPGEGYEQIAGSEMVKISRLSRDERDCLFSVAESFTENMKTRSVKPADGKWPVKFDISTVWGKYNEEEKHEVKELLVENGWKFLHNRNDGVEYWQRPGKDVGDESISATLGQLHNMFYCWSDNADGFEAKTAYSFFDIYMILKHGGNKESAIKDLEKKYGIHHYNYNSDNSDTTNSEHASVTTKKRAKPIQSFPIDGLPEFIQNLINECVEVYKTPLDFWAAAIFAATATGIGNSMKLSGKYTNNSALWWMLVAPSGSGKSEPLDFALNPFNELDAENYRKFMLEKSDYDNIMKLSKKERENQGIHEIPPPPVCPQTILKDFTPEAMAVVHGNNPRGIVLYRDELMGWVNDIGRYTKSGELETMLTIWSGKGVVVNRKSETPLRVENPCITISGGVQVKKLHDLAKDGRADNGMIQRCMFIWPDCCEKSYYSKKTLSQLYRQKYGIFVKNLLSIPDGQVITLNDDAEVLYSEFFNQNADKANAEAVDFIKEMYAKLDIIALRLALIVHGMKIGCEENFTPAIEPETMEYAIRVTEYFRATAMKVYDQLSDNTTFKIKTRDVILYLKNDCGITNQSEIARFLKVSQQYINKTFTGSL